MSKNYNFLMGVLLGTLIVVCLCGCGKKTAYYVDSSEVEKDAQSTEVSTEVDSQRNVIYVYVCGQIQKPGVYTLPEGSRIYDLFALAGGFTKEAATDYWNQARLLKDGEMFYVPTREEAEGRQLEGGRTGNAQTDDTGKVNINTASKEELMSLPGIGEAKAAAIITYREKNGLFSSIEELKQVEGIKEGVFSKMKDYIEI